MEYEIGKTYLITTEGWFMAPDGNQYRAVFGEYHGTFSAEETLGVQTNRHSTNWYMQIGNLKIAGCQIHYAMQTDECSHSGSTIETWHEGYRVVATQAISSIYFADLIYS